MEVSDLEACTLYCAKIRVLLQEMEEADKVAEREFGNYHYL